MQHYNFELENNFDKTDLKNHFENAKNDVKRINGKIDVEFELEENTINKKFNERLGVFEKYRVLKSGNLIGYLEFFRNNDYNYLNIYTSPIT